MKNKWKSHLKDSSKPNSDRKDDFIRKCRKYNIYETPKTYRLICRQIAYIRKPVWLISFLALMISVWGIYGNTEIVYAIAAIMPFVSGIAVIETFRSRMHGMTEMESVTLISMRGIIFARVFCIGISHILLLFTLTMIVSRYSELGFFMTGAFLTIPYLISSIVCFELERSLWGRKNVFISLVVSVIVSSGMLVLQNQRYLLTEQYKWIWYLTEVVLIFLECRSLKKCFYSEDFAWN